MESREYLRQFYENYDEDGRLLTRHGNVEFQTTVRYIEKYLSPGMRILEIGAATGRYSHFFARRGWRVDAVELLPHNIELFNRNMEPGEHISVRQGDARNLDGIPSDAYDAVLLLGPMYHLFTREDQLQALREAVRAAKPGGTVFAAYCMGDASILSYGFLRGKIKDLMAQCMVDPETFAAFSNPWDIFQLYRVEDIEALRAQLPVTPLHLIAADGYTNHMRAALAEMDRETYELYLKYHFATCERRELLGYSHHTLDVFRKGGAS